MLWATPTTLTTWSSSKPGSAETTAVGSRESLAVSSGDQTEFQRQSRQGFWVSVAANTEREDLSQESQHGTGVETGPEGSLLKCSPQLPFLAKNLTVLQAQPGWMALPVPVTWSRLSWKRPCSQFEIPTPLPSQTSFPRGQDLEKEVQEVRKNSPIFLTCQVL
jgi:hypothetical protein